MTALRILLADDHAIFREGLKSLVETQTDMSVVEEAADGRTAWLRATELQPDVVIMDASMPSMGGAEATRLIRRDCPHTKVLALTVHEVGSYMNQFLEAGASGYLIKRVVFEELVHAVRVIAAGGTYLDPSMAIADPTSPADPQCEPARAERELTGREVEVAQRLTRGHINREIAEPLDVSIKTVETYKARPPEPRRPGPVRDPPGLAPRDLNRARPGPRHLPFPQPAIGRSQVGGTATAIVCKRSLRRETQRYSSAGFAWLQIIPAASITDAGRGPSSREANGRFRSIVRLFIVGRPWVVRNHREARQLTRCKSSY